MEDNLQTKTAMKCHLDAIVINLGNYTLVINPVINNRKGAKTRPNITGTSFRQLHQGAKALHFPGSRGRSAGREDEMHAQ